MIMASKNRQNLLINASKKIDQFWFVDPTM